MILQRYIFRELVSSFLAAFIGFTLVMWIGITLQTLTKYEMVDIGFIMMATPYMLVYMIGYTVPVAALTSATLTYGRFASDNEITAIKAGGIHIHHVVVPALLMASLLSAANIFITDYLVPEAHFQRRVWVRRAHRILIDQLPNEPHQFRFDNFKIAYEGYENEEFKSLYIIRFFKQRILEEVIADRATLAFTEDEIPVFKLAAHTITRFDEFDNTFEHDTISAGAGEFPLANNARQQTQPRALADFTGAHLREAIRGDLPTIYEGFRLKTELHRRLAFGLAPFFLIAIGVPIGIFVKKGSRLAGIGVSLPPLVIFFGLSLFTTNLGHKGKLNPLLAGWSANTVLAVIAVILLVRMYRK
jgi:lipopolysaccharide export LptBFGC system permease protein LptF